MAEQKSPKSPQFLKIDAGGMARRIRQRLEATAGLDITELHRRVSEAMDGAQGSSYGNIYAYVNDPPSNPRPEIVRVIAKVLGLRFEWLATGRGAQRVSEPELPTEQEEGGDLDGAFARVREALSQSTALYDLCEGYPDIQTLMTWTACRAGLVMLPNDEELAFAAYGFEQFLTYPSRVLHPARRNQNGEEETLLGHPTAIRGSLGVFADILDMRDSEITNAQEHIDALKRTLASLLSPINGESYACPKCGFEPSPPQFKEVDSATGE